MVDNGDVRAWSWCPWRCCGDRRGKPGASSGGGAPGGILRAHRGAHHGARRHLRVTWLPGLIGGLEETLDADVEQRQRDAENELRAKWVALYKLMRLPLLTYELFAIPMRAAFPRTLLWSPAVIVVDVFADCFELACVYQELAHDQRLREQGKSGKTGGSAAAASAAGGGGGGVYSRRRMARDLLTILVLHLGRVVFMAAGWPWVWYLGQLVRCGRAHDLVLYVQQLNGDLTTNVTFLAVYKFSIFLFSVPHWVACAWWLISEHSTGAQLELPSWSAQFELLTGNPHFDPHDSTDAQRYLMAAYLAWAGVTALGYGTATFTKTNEIAFAILICLIQIVFYAFVLGTLFHYLVRVDENTAYFKELLRAVDEYCSKRNLPSSISRKIRAHFEFQHAKRSSATETIFDQMPLSLKVKVASARHSRHVQGAWVFYGCNPQFLNQIVIVLKERYVMPLEVLFNKGEGSRELLWLTNGSLHVKKGDSHSATIRSDLGDGQVVGELGFFLGIQQPFTVSATAAGDVTLLVLAGTDYDDTIASYPEQADLITFNLLRKFGLDQQGNALDAGAGAGAGGAGALSEDEQEEFDELRTLIQQAITVRNEEAITQMSYAASIGDVETVRALAAKGLDVNAGNYDKRTTLHLAAAEGNAKVVELLCELGANPNLEDRWGHAPIREAVVSHHDEVADALKRHGAELQLERPAALLLEAVADGSVKHVQALLAHGIEINTADYDGRSALHLASADGNMRLVEYLVSSLADVNLRDRWGNKPIDDALSNGHKLVSQLLVQRGARANPETVFDRLCIAASEGDVELTRFLIDAGAPFHAGDYDARTPLHLAVCAGSISTTHCLVSAMADVSSEDRWGCSALIDALQHNIEVAGLLVQQASAELPERFKDDKVTHALYVASGNISMRSSLEKLHVRTERRMQVITAKQGARRQLELELKGLVRGVTELLNLQTRLFGQLERSIDGWIHAYALDDSDDDGSSQDSLDLEDDGDDSKDGEGDASFFDDEQDKSYSKRQVDGSSLGRAEPGGGSSFGRAAPGGACRSLDEVLSEGGSFNGQNGYVGGNDGGSSFGGGGTVALAACDAPVSDGGGPGASVSSVAGLVTPLSGGPIGSGAKNRRTSAGGDGRVASREVAKSTFLRLVLRLPKAEAGLTMLKLAFERKLSPAARAHLRADLRRVQEEEALRNVLVSDCGFEQTVAAQAVLEIYRDLKALLGPAAPRSGMDESDSDDSDEGGAETGIRRGRSGRGSHEPGALSGNFEWGGIAAGQKRNSAARRSRDPGDEALGAPGRDSSRTSSKLGGGKRSSVAGGSRSLSPELRSVHRGSTVAGAGNPIVAQRGHGDSPGQRPSGARRGSGDSHMIRSQRRSTTSPRSGGRDPPRRAGHARGSSHGGDAAEGAAAAPSEPAVTPLFISEIGYGTLFFSSTFVRSLVTAATGREARANQGTRTAASHKSQRGDGGSMWAGALRSPIRMRRTMDANELDAAASQPAVGGGPADGEDEDAAIDAARRGRYARNRLAVDNLGSMLRTSRLSRLSRISHIRGPSRVTGTSPHSSAGGEAVAAMLAAPDGTGAGPRACTPPTLTGEATMILDRSRRGGPANGVRIVPENEPSCAERSTDTLRVPVPGVARGQSGASDQSLTSATDAASRQALNHPIALVESVHVLEQLYEVFDGQRRGVIRFRDVRALQGTLGELGGSEIRSLVGHLLDAAAALSGAADKQKGGAAAGGGGGGDEGGGAAEEDSAHQKAVSRMPQVTARPKQLSPSQFYVGAAAWILSTAEEEAAEMAELGEAGGAPGVPGSPAGAVTVGVPLLKIGAKDTALGSAVPPPGGAKGAAGSPTKAEAMAAADDADAQLTRVLGTADALAMVGNAITSRIESGRLQAKKAVTPPELAAIVAATVPAAAAATPSDLAGWYEKRLGGGIRLSGESAPPEPSAPQETSSPAKPRRGSYAGSYASGENKITSPEDGAAVTSKTDGGPRNSREALEGSSGHSFKAAAAARGEPPAKSAPSAAAKPDPSAAAGTTWEALAKALSDAVRQLQKQAVDARVRAAVEARLTNRLLAGLRRALEHRGSTAGTSPRSADGGGGGAEHPWWVVAHTSLAYRLADRFFIALVVWDLLQMPVHLCFAAEVERLAWVWPINYAVDAYYIARIALRFATSFQNSKSVTVYAPAEIRRNYLATDFTLDALAAWPNDLLALALGVRGLVVVALRLLKLVNARYVLRAYRHFERTKADDNLLTGLVQYNGIILLTSHVCACLFNVHGYSALPELAGGYAWPQQFNDHVAAVGGTSADDLDPSVVSPEAILAHRYVVSMYFVISAITTLGSGQMPANYFEIGFQLFLMLLNFTVYAFAVGKISALVMRQDDEIVTKRAQLELVQVYLNHVKVPSSLRAQIEAFFHARLRDASLSAVADEQIYAQMPIALQIEVSRVTNRALVGDCPLFKNCSDGFVDRLSSLLRERTVEPETILFRVTEVCKELFILESGMVEVYDEGEEEEADGAETVSAGETLGELPFVFGMRHVSNARSTHAQETKLFALTAERYKVLLKSFPQQEDVLMDNAMQIHSGGGGGGFMSARSAKSKASSRRSLARRSSAGQSMIDFDDLHSVAGRSAKSAKTAHLEELGTIQKIIANAKKKRSDLATVQLCGACAKGELDKVRHLLSTRDIDVNAGDYDRRRPLHVAACAGHVEVMEVLIFSGADVSVVDRNGTTPLHDALTHRQDAAARVLLAHGAQRMYPHIADLLCAVAARRGSLEELRYLVAFDPTDVNTANHGKRTALHLAAAEGNVEAARLLIQHAADVNAQDRRGSTPLQEAFHGRHAEISELLLRHSANMGEFDAAVQFCAAAARNDVATLQRLIDHHCDVNAGDYDARTALHLATSNARVHATHFLLELPNINPNVEDRYGNTPLDDAMREQGEEQPIVRTLLTTRGAKLGSHQVPDGGVSSDDAEEVRFMKDVLEVEEQKKYLPTVRELKRWVLGQVQDTRHARKLVDAAISLEREKGEVISEQKPDFWAAIREFAQGHQPRRWHLINTVQPTVQQWHEQFRDFAFHQTHDLQQRVNALLQLQAAVARPLEALMEANFDLPDEETEGGDADDDASSGQLSATSGAQSAQPRTIDI